LLAVRTPTGQAAVFFDEQGPLLDLDLLHEAWCCGTRLQVLPAGGAKLEAVLVGTAVEEFGPEQRSLVVRVPWLATGEALVGAVGWRWLGRLDEIERRRFGLSRRILVEACQFFLDGLDGPWQRLNLDLEGGHLPLQALTVGTGGLASLTHHAPLYEPATEWPGPCEPLPTRIPVPPIAFARRG